MKPIYSDEDRSKAVKNFIAARYQRLVKIQSFEAIRAYLNEKRVRVLCTLKRSGIDRDDHGDIVERFYDLDDVATYFDWLTHVVTGAENASEDTIKEATNQLFIFILALKDNTEMDDHVRIVEPYNWECRLDSIAKSLSDFQSNEEKRDLEICNILTKIHELVKRYHMILVEMKRDYDVNIKKVFKDD